MSVMTMPTQLPPVSYGGSWAVAVAGEHLAHVDAAEAQVVEAAEVAQEQHAHRAESVEHA